MPKNSIDQTFLLAQYDQAAERFKASHDLEALADDVGIIFSDLPVKHEELKASISKLAAVNNMPRARKLVVNVLKGLAEQKTRNSALLIVVFALFASFVLGSCTGAGIYHLAS